jgi:hypothetical protein
MVDGPGVWYDTTNDYPERACAPKKELEANGDGDREKASPAVILGVPVMA